MHASRHRAATGTCTHHWIIATPNGHFSQGICKHCGTERNFENSESERLWRNRRSGRKEPASNRA
ncbi:MAG: hypothetical protein OXE43_08525 [Chloroflexi bacterium]|nr:hypothetical protein [Chloroflexota bacterium]